MAGLGKTVDVRINHKEEQNGNRGIGIEQRGMGSGGAPESKPGSALDQTRSAAPPDTTRRRNSEILFPMFYVKPSTALIQTSIGA